MKNGFEDEEKQYECYNDGNKCTQTKVEGMAMFTDINEINVITEGKFEIGSIFFTSN